MKNRALFWWFLGNNFMRYYVMKRTDDFEIVLSLRTHGWSSFYFIIDGAHYELVASHVFCEPYTALINSLMLLLEGEFETEFIMYGEPCGNKITIKRIKEQKHIIQVDVFDFSECYGTSIKRFDEVVGFETYFEQFLLGCYLQLKKISLLMSNKVFNKDRKDDFPFAEYKLFEKKILLQFPKLSLPLYP
jgi:hypothetical protein